MSATNYLLLFYKRIDNKEIIEINKNGGNK